MQKKEQYTLHYDDERIEATLVYSRRTTLEFAVYPDASLIIRAPSHMDTPTLEAKIQKRLPWIIKKIHYFKECAPVRQKLRYVDGEEHFYLGAPYILKIREGNENLVRLSENSLSVICKKSPTPSIVQQLLRYWYTQNAHVNFGASLERAWSFFALRGFLKPSITVRAMKTRWGSLSTKGRMTLNLELIKTPQACIDYVVMHELCHLQYRNHSADFYALLTEVLPCWKEHKALLEQSARIYC